MRLSLRAVATMSVTPALSSPERSASPMRPAPMIAMRDIRESLRCGAQGQQPARVAREQVHARDAGPLAVRLEQLGRLPALDLTAAQHAQELDESEVADEPVVHAAEPFEADDADRPRAEAALALEPLRDDSRRLTVQALELDRAAQADESGAAT